jgi:hypothetical protein
MISCWAIALACNLSSLVTGTFASMLGPGLALRGGGNAVTRAVLGVRVEHVWTLSFHLTGLFAFVVGLIVMSCLRLRGTQPLVLTAVFSSAVLLGVYRIKTMKAGLAINKQKAEEDELQQLKEMGLGPEEMEYDETNNLLVLEGEDEEAEHAAVGPSEDGGADAKAKAPRKSLSSRLSFSGKKSEDA